MVCPDCNPTLEVSKIDGKLMCPSTCRRFEEQARVNCGE